MHTHVLLIAKMKAYGLSDEACTFMSSYICYRCHRVNVSNTKSPFLVHVFMNDILWKFVIWSIMQMTIL